MSLYIPKNHLPKLPASLHRNDKDRTEQSEAESMNCMLYGECAWYAYWKWVSSVARRYGWGLQKAREWVHSRGKVPEITDDEFPGWDSDDAVSAFMMQFPTWQWKGYDRDAMMQEAHIYDHAMRFGCNKDWAVVGKDRLKPWTLSQFMGILSWTQLAELPCHLEVCHRRQDMKFLSNDPIFGAEMRFELRMAETHDSWDADEVLRRSALPEPLATLDMIVTKGEPTLYSLMYPHDRVQNTFEGRKQVHDIDNCLTILGDGGCIFRVEVLDTVNFTRFRLAEMCPPWWSLCGGIGGTDPETAEYDFPFPDFGIYEGDEFTFDRFVAVCEEGVTRMKTRADRKFGSRSEE